MGALRGECKPILPGCRLPGLRADTLMVPGYLGVMTSAPPGGGTPTVPGFLGVVDVASGTWAGMATGARTVGFEDVWRSRGA